MAKAICNNIEINYTECGQGEPLILIMGLGAGSEKWADHIAAYKEHFHCIALDNRGAGLSAAPSADAYTTEEMAEDTVALMDALHIESAHIHGISMGGAIAQVIAIRYPERVRSLILTSTFARASNGFRRAIEILRDINGIADGDTFTHLLNWMIWSDEYHEHHYSELLKSEAKDAQNPNPMSVGAFRAQCNACISHDVLSELYKITAPTLVARGGADLLAPMYITEELVKGIPNAESYVCPGGGHVHHWEFLKEFNEATLAFLLRHRKEGVPE